MGRGERNNVEYDGDKVKNLYYKKRDTTVQTVTFEYEDGRIKKIIRS